MASLLLPLLVALLPLLLLLKARFFPAPGKRTGSSKLPPGPPPLPLIGNLHLLGRSPHLSLRRLALTYGPVLHLSLGETPTVVLSSASAAREALRTHDLPLASRPPIYAAKKLFYGCSDVAFAPYGSYWRGVRKLCILQLLSNRRVDSYAPARAAEVALMLSRIAAAAAAAGGGGAVNVSKVLGMYASGVLCRAAFGRDFVEGGDYERRGFESMLHEYQVLLGGFSLGDFIPSLEWLNTVTGMKRRLEKTFRRFDEFFDQIIEEHLERRRKKDQRDDGDDEEEESMDFVDVLLDAQEEETTELPLTMDNVKAVILDMFAAGTDTTFITLDWAMTELLMNPSAMKRAQAEVRSIVGGGDGRTLVSEADDLPRMPYLKAVIKEVFRLHPPAPLLVPRESMEAVTIGGYEIPAKTRLFVNAAIGRDPELWEDPDAFAPERFLRSSIDFKGQDFELIPFGSGRRGCPAITFGTASVELALAQLLHDFDWELPPGVKADDLEMDEVFGITMHRREQLVAVATPHGA